MISSIRFLYLLPLIVATGLFAAGEEVPSEGKEPIRFIIDPIYRTELTSQVNTPVQKIYKRMGDSFKEGEILIHMDDDIFQGNLLKAQAALSRAETELAAKQQLYHDNVGSKFELVEAEANLATAKAELILAKKNLESSTLLAPYDGKVVNLYIEEHELPSSGKELIELVDDNILIAKLLVPSSRYTEIEPGKTIHLNIAETGQKIDAKITRIGAVIDPSSSTIRVEAEIDNRDGKLKSGMTGEAQF